MRKVFRFPADKVRELVEHANGSPDWKQTYAESVYGQPKRPALWLVKDDGVYLMSNGEPGKTVSGLPPAVGRELVTVRASGHATWIGGNDFVEAIPTADLTELDEADEVAITVTGGFIRVEVVG